MPIRKRLLPLLAIFAAGYCDHKNNFTFAKKDTTEDEPAFVKDSLHIISDTLPDQSAKFLPVTQRIFAGLKPAPEGEAKTYTQTIPLSDKATLRMIPIPGGEFTIGSPDSEKGRSNDEGPQRAIKIGPFWMVETEITWGQYFNFMVNGKRRNKDGSINLDGDSLHFRETLRQRSTMPFPSPPPTTVPCTTVWETMPDLIPNIQRSA